MGLAHLDSAKFKLAAKKFASVSFTQFQQFNDVLSSNDIAIYGGLCALSSLDRKELKQCVFENTEFKQFLELEPELRDIINNFYNSKYGACLNLLEKKKVRGFDFQHPR